MDGVNREWLLEAKAWAEKEIERTEIRRANQPMFDAFQNNAENLVTRKVPDTLAGSQATLRESALKLEQSLHDSEARQAKAEDGRQRRLIQAHARTNALRVWLEVLG